MDPIDYTVQYNAIVSALQAISTTLAESKQAIVDLNTTIAALQADVNALKQLGSDRDQGIASFNVKDAVERAVVVNAIREGGQLDKVKAEIANPTNLI